MTDTPCPRCGRVYGIGEWPGCPHGFPAGNRRAMVDEWPMGKTFTASFPTPQTFYSRSAYQKALAARGLVIRGDGEEHFATLGAEGLAKAEALIRRVHAG